MGVGYIVVVEFVWCKGVGVVLIKFMEEKVCELKKNVVVFNCEFDNYGVI